MSLLAARDRIKRAIETRAYVDVRQGTIVQRNKQVKTEGWLIDIRSILLDSDVLSDIAEVFWDSFREMNDVQIGGIETAAIPLITSLVTHAKTYAQREHTSGFYIRKSRKKDGLLKMIEGTLVPDVPVILVDDLINSGQSLIRQVEVLRDHGTAVHAVWTLVRFRDPEFYTYFSERNIPIYSLFTLNDFHDSLGLSNRTSGALDERYAPFRVLWRYGSPRPSYQHVVPKSDPVIDEQLLFIGSDTGHMRALRQKDGGIAWEFKTGTHAHGKGIFSTPALHNGVLYFGSYDGNVYALDAMTGRTKWTYWDADWVGSSPTLAPDLGILFIGLEFGLWRKRGGIAALDMRTGKTAWEHIMPCYTHSSPLYIPKHAQVVIGSNDGAVYLYNASTGTLLWKYEKAALTARELETGFGERDIKESFAYDAARDIILFGAMDGTLTALERSTGRALRSFQAEFGIYSTPIIHGDTVIFSSLDKHLYCLNIDTLELKWRWYAGARLFATPVIMGGMIYIGANTGRLTVLDAESGLARTYFTVSERITNRIAFNPITRHLFLTTFANEVYCLEQPPSMADITNLPARTTVE